MDMNPARLALLYHFCRLQMPAVSLPLDAATRHLQRTYEVYHRKEPSAGWDRFLDNLYPLDWFLASACLEGDGRAWETLFAARTSRADCLLIDALRARATRLYPRDEEKQESAVTEFWSNLIVPTDSGGKPILARYDGQRPLVPWLIRVFQNWHISQLRQHGGTQTLPEDDVVGELPASPNGRWHESFCLAARDWLSQLGDQELLLLGLRLRYRLSQREVAGILGVHEGTISRQTAQLRDRCLDSIGQRLVAEGWTGDNLAEFVLNEMGHLLLDEPRLSADQLATLLHARGLKVALAPPA
jgi:RNA polymerase sigma factor (sigma-70 family)